MPAPQAQPFQAQGVPAVCRSEDGSPVQAGRAGKVDLEKGAGAAKAGGLAKPLLAGASEKKVPPRGNRHFIIMGLVGLALVLFFLAEGFANLGTVQESATRHRERVAQEEMNKEVKSANSIAENVVVSGEKAIVSAGKAVVSRGKAVVAEGNNTSLAFVSAAGAAGLCVVIAAVGACCKSRPLASHRASGFF